MLIKYSSLWIFLFNMNVKLKDFKITQREENRIFFDKLFFMNNAMYFQIYRNTSVPVFVFLSFFSSCTSFLFKRVTDIKA